MSHRDWLTVEELLRELDQAGIAVPERTLRFWIAHQVLPGPVRKPFRGADGRVGYYSREILTVIPKVVKLQGEGWKLRQISERLAKSDGQTRGDGPVNTPDVEDEIASKFLLDLLSDTEARDRRRCFQSPGAATSELRQIRHYLVARLERWLSRAAAVRATSAFLLGLTPRDMQRLVSRLRLSAISRFEKNSKPVPSSNQGESFDSETFLARLSNAEVRAKLAAQLEQQLADLAAFSNSTHPSPVLLIRTNSCLQKMISLLRSRDYPSKEAPALIHELNQLAEIARFSASNLDYLRSDAGGR